MPLARARASTATSVPQDVGLVDEPGPIVTEGFPDGSRSDTEMSPSGRTLRITRFREAVPKGIRPKAVARVHGLINWHVVGLSMPATMSSHVVDTGG